MRCSRCAEHEATVHLTEVADGTATATHLCSGCYAAVSGQEPSDVASELREAEMRIQALEARTSGFDVRPERLRLHVGEAFDLLDLAVYARTGWLRRERISWSLDPATLDAVVAEIDATGCLAARAPGRTRLCLRPDWRDREGQQAVLAVEVEVLP